MSRLGEAQTAAEDGHEKDPSQGIALGPHGEESFDLLDTEHWRGWTVRAGRLMPAR